MLNTMMKFLLQLYFGASFSFASIDTIDVDVGISVFKDDAHRNRAFRRGR